mgnify:CR=1 FL=1
MIRKAPCFALFLTAAVVAAEPFDWKFDASESWKAEPSLPLCIGFDGLELLPPKTPEWGKPPVVYSLREAGSQKTPGNPEQPRHIPPPSSPALRPSARGTVGRTHQPLLPGHRKGQNQPGRDKRNIRRPAPDTESGDHGACLKYHPLP